MSNSDPRAGLHLALHLIGANWTPARLIRISTQCLWAHMALGGISPPPFTFECHLVRRMGGSFSSQDILHTGVTYPVTQRQEHGTRQTRLYQLVHNYRGFGSKRSESTNTITCH